MREPKPPQFKTYPDTPIVPLPHDLPAEGPSAVGALEGSAAQQNKFDIGHLAAALFLSAGVVRSREQPGGAEWFRAAGSSGNLSPLEVYVITGGLDGLPPGIYHYQSVEHGLVRLRAGDHRARLAAALAIPRQSVGAVAFVISGIPWRAGWKYEERGFRNLYRDAGTMLSQLLAATAAHRRELILGFVDPELSALLDLPHPHEVPLAVVTVGQGQSVPDAPPLSEAPTGFLGHAFKVFPLVVAAQAAGEHLDAHAVAAWRASAAESIHRRAAPSGHSTSAELLPDAIRRRGSARRFRRGAAPNELLTWALPVGMRTEGDFLAPGATLLEHHLLVHDVEGFAPGVYHLVDGTLACVRKVDCRDEATRLCLDQPLAGGGALAVYHATHLSTVVARLGDRGYRAALMEAGMVSGRLHLTTQLLGLGASGLTFYDDEVRSFMPTESDPLLVTTVGQLAYRALGGGLPGRPTQLRPAGGN